MVSIDGLVSGIDTASVIEGLLSVHQGRIDRLKVKKDEVLAEQTAFKEVEARVLNVQSQLSRLIRLRGNAVDAKTVSSSHEDLATAAVSNEAQPGVYQLRVNQLAQAHQISTQGFASASAEVTTGTLGIQIGDGLTHTIEVTETNNTLQGLAESINSSGAKVYATVIDDGSSEDSFRLMLAAQETGTSNAITLTNELDETDQAALKPMFSGRTTTASEISTVALADGYGAAATLTSNEGAATYTGGADDTYTFTIAQSGIVGRDAIRIDFADGNGENTGSIVYDPADADSFVDIAEGVQIKLKGDAIAVAGNSFDIQVTGSDGTVGPAVADAANSADSTVTVNSGPGSYTGSDDDTYTFRILNSGVVGHDDIDIGYSDRSGDAAGVLTISAADAGQFMAAADGIQVKLDAGFVLADQEFQVDVYAEDGYIRSAVYAPSFDADATPSVNAGEEIYSGSDDDTYNFTITQGGVVGEDAIEISFADGSGDNTGTITYGPDDVGLLKDVAEGLQIQFDEGLVIAGDQFSVDVTATKQSGVLPIQEPQDAEITIGSGDGAITIRSETNQFDEVIPGVTIDLLAADSDQPITLTIGNDIETAKEAVTNFVDAYNDLMGFISEQTRFDPATGEAAVLLGNRSVSTIQDRVRRATTELVSGVDGSLNRLSALGIRLQSSGQLSVNSSRLDDVLNGRVEGVSLADVRKLFALEGETENPNIRFLLGSRNTKETAGATPYRVEITQAAERASVLGGNVLPQQVHIADNSATFNVRVDGKSSSTLELTPGDYSHTEMASHLESLINSDEELGGRRVTVTVDDGRLRINSASYGDSSEVTIEGGAALASLALQGSESAFGKDVVGVFHVPDPDDPGKFLAETAIGNGRILSGSRDNDYTADLQLLVSLTPGQVASPVETDLAVTRGIAAGLDELMGTLVESQRGLLKNANDSFDSEIQDLDDVMEKLNDRFDTRQESLVRRFAEMEAAIGEFQAIGSSLNTQLLSLASF